MIESGFVGWWLGGTRPAIVHWQRGQAEQVPRRMEVRAEAGDWQAAVERGQKSLARDDLLAGRAVDPDTPLWLWSEKTIRVSVSAANARCPLSSLSLGFLSLFCLFLFRILPNVPSLPRLVLC